MSPTDLRHHVDFPRTSVGIFQIMQAGVVIEGPVPTQSFIRPIVEPITFSGDLWRARHNLESGSEDKERDP